MQPIQIVVQFVDGKLMVNGPLHDKILCLGLLRMAEHQVLAYQPGPAAGIEVPPAGLAASLATPNRR